MLRTFIYTAPIEQRLKEMENKEEFCRGIEIEILNNITVGDLVPGLAGARKFRYSDPSRGKGKRGGFRIFFLDLPLVEKVYFLYLLSKGETEDITAQEKKEFKKYIDLLKKEAKHEK